MQNVESFETAKYLLKSLVSLMFTQTSINEKIRTIFKVVIYDFGRKPFSYLILLLSMIIEDEFFASSWFCNNIIKSLK